MSVDDLAIDVGLAVNTDEYDVFVACVQNILDCGCKYNEETMDNIIQKCQTSKLDIAAQVIRECRQPAQLYRKSRSHKKWWETYQSKSQRIRKYRSSERRSSERRSSERRSSECRSSERRSPERRIPMNLEFKPEPKKMNLEFKKKSTVKYEEIPRWPGRAASPIRQRPSSPPLRYVRTPQKFRRDQRRPDNRYRSQHEHRRSSSHYEHRRSSSYRDRRPPSPPQRHRKRRRY